MGARNYKIVARHKRADCKVCDAARVLTTVGLVEQAGYTIMQNWFFVHATTVRGPKGSGWNYKDGCSKEFEMRENDVHFCWN